MTKVLVAADGKWLRDRVRRALAAPDTEVFETARGQDVRAVVAEHDVDLVVLDLQIGNMGGIAVAIDLHLEAAAGRIPPVKKVLLLDREADRFLAKRAAADAELVKPIDPVTLRRTVTALLAEDVPERAPA